MADRRLAAIGVADVVGYSAMMAEDEEGTLSALKAHIHATDPILFNHGGRIVKRTGDGVLFEVPSVVEAVRGAIEMQQLMKERNASLPEGRRMEYRIGINLGDVMIEDDGDIFGDGVNVASRLETLASAGGICVSDTVYQHVRNSLDVGFIDLGEIEVKGIPRPIHAWALDEGAEIAEGRGYGEAAPTAARRLASLVVLPFANMSSDRDQDYFADGITEDLITALSHIRELAVVSRNSAFVYKDTAMDIRQIARELDATHVIEGSVRRSGDRVRITAQLIDAESAHHVWAERFDRQVEDMFALQDEMVEEIAAQITPSLTVSEGEKRGRRPPGDLNAWDLLLRARWRAHSYTEEGITAAIALGEQALDLDQTLSQAHVDLAQWWTMVWFSGWKIPDRPAEPEIQRYVAAALSTDPHNPLALSFAAVAANVRGNIDEALRLGRRAVDLGPHHPMARMIYGHALTYEGDSEAAVEELTKAWRIARHEVWRFYVAFGLSAAHYHLRRYDSAAAWTDRGLRVTEYLQLHIVAAAALAQLGKNDEARAHLDHLLRIRPNMTASRFGKSILYRHPADVDHFLEGLIKAGLPE